MDVELDLRARVAELMPRAKDELAELVGIRSVADPRQFPPEECDRAATWVLEHFAELGFTNARLERTADGSNAVVGSRPCARADAPTVLLYAHYDVQPPLDDAIRDQLQDYVIRRRKELGD
jgi:acetylornithine deacetylase/succinyl-diaminopimelate desuccinylase-like protein